MIKNRRFWVIILGVLLCCVNAVAQKSDWQQRAEAEDAKRNVANARSLYLQAYDDYVRKGQTAQGVECGVKACALYYKSNLYKEAFDLLRGIDQVIAASKGSSSEKSGMHYLTTKERMQMYMKLRKSDRANELLGIMENYVNASGDENLKNDLLYTKAIYYYSLGQTTQGNAVFKEMATKLTAQGDYNKVDEVYRTLIANSRKSNSAGLVDQSYSSYMAWKDSVSAIQAAAIVDSLKRQISANEAVIAEKDDSLSARDITIYGLCILAVVLAVVLVLGTMVLMRFIVKTRKQKKTISLANESNALKAKFISNISAQMEPTLKKLDGKKPEVKALMDFARDIQMLSDVENSTENVELEEMPILPMCEALMDEIRNRVKSDVVVTLNVPKTEAKINKTYVEYVLRHLLRNAAEYAPEGGKVTLDYKKRGPHSHQFLVTNTGDVIPEEKRDDLFKPFREIKDLTDGDGLGLPICKQMALKMNGDLEIDPTFTKGMRFVLNLHV